MLEKENAALMRAGGEVALQSLQGQSYDTMATSRGSPGDAVFVPRTCQKRGDCLPISDGVYTRISKPERR